MGRDGAETALSLRWLWILLCLLAAWSGAAIAAPPGVPAISSAAAERGGKASIVITPPASDGGSAITSYTVTSNPGNLTATGSTNPIMISGLSYGQYYSFTATAANADGNSANSAASNYVWSRPFSPTAGTINNLVVFLRFADQPEFTQTLSYYDGLFNSAANSLKNFYLENSYGAVTVNSGFYPTPAGGAVASYQDSHPTTYYQPYDATTNPGGYQGSEVTTRETALLANIFAAIGSQIPAGLNLDGDGDGYLDHVAFEVYSSDANPLPVYFYSRVAFDSSGTIVVNGKHLGSFTYVSSPQDNPETYLASTEIHEMGHSFGYPDLRGAGTIPVADYDVMSLSVPAHSGAYMKSRFTNWISNIPEITSYGTYSINDLTQATNNAYKIKLANGETLVLEYRKATGAFESHLPGSGLCISRVNEKAGLWGNLNGPPYFIYYFRVDGTPSSDGAGRYFNCLNAETGRTQFNDQSNPSCFKSDGSGCGISVYGISDTSGTSMTFSVGDPAAITLTHLIQGYLYNGGNRVRAATVTLSGSASATTTTDNLGRYLFTVADGGTYTVTPSAANMSFNPVSKVFAGVTSDQTYNFPASTNTNTLSGTVSSDGVAVAGASVYASCSSGSVLASPLTTDSNGAYSFIAYAGSTCQVWASKTNYQFSPANHTYTNFTTDMVQDFTTVSYVFALSGQITLGGSALAGIDISCPGATSASSAVTDASGNYSFNVTVGKGGAYTVTPSSGLYTFSPASRVYSGILGNQSAQNYAATAIATTTTTSTTSTTSTTTTAATTTTTTQAPVTTTTTTVPTTTTTTAATTTTTAPTTSTTSTTSTTTTATPTTATAATTTTTTQAPVTTTTTTVPTTTGALTTTTVVTTTTTTQAPAFTLDFVQGWNLVGNGSDVSIDVTATFADTGLVASVWKWVAAQSAWAFHAPSLAAQGGTVLADYAASKGYQLLTTVAGGEGYWLNAKQAGTVLLPAGTAITAAALGSTIGKGWHLLSIGEPVAPKQFCDDQSGGLISLWAWDSLSSNWYFYAPSLEAQGGTALSDYIATKAYLDFNSSSKVLGNGTGFWVNRP